MPDEVTTDLVTAKVLASLSSSSDPRLREISEAVIRHLHALVVEVGLTVGEWRGAIDFLTRTGAMCTEDRQEFMLLSDVLGVSMLVDAVNHPGGDGSTEHTVIGPFYTAAPTRPIGADIAGDSVGMPLFFSGIVTNEEGESLSDAIVDVWQSDANGFYDVQLGPERNLRARFTTGSGGGISLWSVVPSAYPIPNDGPVGELLVAQGRHPYRPAHVHFRIDANGYEELITHVFISGDKYLDSDVVFGTKPSLIRAPEYLAPGIAPDGWQVAVPWAHLSYDFVLRSLG
ncbi:MAG TPA: dioxygenase [Acidimicrobiales bacterium]